MSLKSIFDQQFTHFLSSAALCIEAVGFSMALCAAVAAASVITSSSVASPRAFWIMPRTRIGKSMISTWLYLRSPHLARVRVRVRIRASSTPKPNPNSPKP